MTGLVVDLGATAQEATLSNSVRFDYSLGP